jgi:hypothetical protein
MKGARRTSLIFQPTGQVRTALPDGVGVVYLQAPQHRWDNSNEEKMVRPDEARAEAMCWAPHMLGANHTF